MAHGRDRPIETGQLVSFFTMPAAVTTDFGRVALLREVLISREVQAIKAVRHLHEHERVLAVLEKTFD